jgi:hypothetical protein
MSPTNASRARTGAVCSVGYRHLDPSGGRSTAASKSVAGAGVDLPTAPWVRGHGFDLPAVVCSTTAVARQPDQSRPGAHQAAGPARHRCRSGAQLGGPDPARRRRSGIPALRRLEPDGVPTRRAARPRVRGPPCRRPVPDHGGPHRAPVGLHALGSVRRARYRTVALERPSSGPVCRGGVPVYRVSQFCHRSEAGSSHEFWSWTQESVLPSAAAICSMASASGGLTSWPSSRCAAAALVATARTKRR